ncbi:hypothetical protein [Caudoviricetes sp.]|nr:hypothetical protein [Caudoviricetes sp.]UOF80998.1 hypothetical protein [Caudoviricetes sp.]UOF81394.1 hypothetical protein [Caudoviricetes sp.]
MPYSYGIAEGVSQAGEAIAAGLERRFDKAEARARERKSSMQIGKLLDEETLQILGQKSPEMAQMLRSIRPGLASGDLTLSDVAPLLSKDLFPKPESELEKAQANYYNAFTPTTVAEMTGSETQSQDTIQVPELSSTESMLKKVPLLPGQALLESVGRKTGQLTRMREVPKGLEESYKARTAAAATGLGDTANIAVAEREMMQQSFPQDGDTYESRLTKEQSIDNFIANKIELLDKIVDAKVPMIASGRRLIPDPTYQALKKQALIDRKKLGQAQVMYKEMFKEANKKMPPIGAEQKKVSKLSDSQKAIRDRLLGGK